MTLQEFYQQVGGDYEETLGRIPSAQMLHRFILKFCGDKTFDNLCRAVEAEQWDETFRAGHTLKGLAQNLGFERLYRAAFELTEAVRGPQALTDAVLLEHVKKEYAMVMDAIGKLD